ncbi:MAG: alpha/beta fold hydrolase [Gaiellaceae bacterium]
MRSDIPRTRFVNGPDGARIAYQVVGSGPVDVILVTDWASSIDLMWDIPQIERFLRRLASVGRLILFDKRGNGASDAAPIERGQFGATMEQAAGDLLAVLDAAESERAAVVASTFGGWPSLLFAATHPGRCARLVLQDCAPRLVRGDDYPQGVEASAVEAAVESIRSDWGRGLALVSGAPDLLADDDLRHAVARYERLAVERMFMAQAWMQMAEIDMRAVLPLIRAETLVIAHRAANPISGGGAGAALGAEQIPDATFVPLDGTAALYWADERVADEIVRFLATDEQAATADERVLAAVLFTDLVDSTSQLAEIGDRQWRELLDRHDRLTSEILDRFRGRLIDRAGDGLLAIFDGPARGVRCAQAICTEVRALGLEVRAGVHVGEVELCGDTVRGIAVHIAARVMGLADAGEVVVSRTVKDLTAGSGLRFADRGTHQLKGVDEPWQTYVLAAAD